MYHVRQCFTIAEPIFVVFILNFYKRLYSSVHILGLGSRPLYVCSIVPPELRLAA